MTTLNNLKGHLVSDGQVIYAEKLANGLTFCIIAMYEPPYEKENYGDDPSLYLISCVTESVNNIHQWTNGAKSFTNVYYTEKIKPGGNFKDLEKVFTKDGCEIFQHAYQYKKTADFEERIVRWLTRTPKEFFYKIIKEQIKI